jgi:hypothetical protein
MKTDPIRHNGAAIHAIFEGDLPETEKTNTNQTITVLELSDEDRELAKFGRIVDGKILESLPYEHVPPPFLGQTMTFVDPDDGVSYEISITDEDMLTATKLKAWFDLGGGPRDWTFQNGTVINVNAAQLQTIATAFIAEITPSL